MLKNAHRLRSSMIPDHRDISIFPDLTKKQRQVEYKLRTELKMRKENGETGLTISKGKIVQTSVQAQSRVSTPHVIRVSTGGALCPQSHGGNIQVKSTAPGRKLPQPHMVKVGEMTFRSPMANSYSAPAGAFRTMEKTK